MIIQDINIDEDKLSPHELEEIKRLLSTCYNEFLEIEELWKLMDNVWDDYGYNQADVTDEQLFKYYQHPVWILNGLFSERHEESQLYRRKILNWLELHKNEISSVLDYGGGLGNLGRSLAGEFPDIKIDIYEPSPHFIALELAKPYTNLQYIDSFDYEYKYDCVICLDVMEHLLDPLNVLKTISDLTMASRYSIFGNCFLPIIKCHLPRNFHLRYTFSLFAKSMGLRPDTVIQRRYLQVYKKTRLATPDWNMIRTEEKISRSVYPLIKMTHSACNVLKPLLLN